MMSSSFHAANHRRRRARYSAQAHQMREDEQRRLRRGENEAIVACDPPHANGCLRCFVARMEKSRQAAGGES